MSDTQEKKLAYKRYPSNNEAEQYMLCCILIDGEVASTVVPEMDEKFFFNATHAKIFKAMQKLVAQNVAIDVITVYDSLVKANESDVDILKYLTELSQITPSAVNYRDFFNILHRDMVMRELIKIGNAIAEDAYHSEDEESSLRKAESMIYDIGAKGAQAGMGLEHISKAGQRYIDRLIKMRKDKNAVKGLRTHYPIFDATTNGLQPASLIILAARPSVGKTAFALNLVANMIRNGNTNATIAMFCLEMSREELVQRMLSINTDVTMSSLSSARISDEEYDRLWDAHVAESNCNIYLDYTSNATPGYIASQCRRLRSLSPNKQLDLVIIDYLQLMSNDKQNIRSSSSRQTDVSDISRALKNMAMDLQCPVIALSQMSRSIEGRDDKQPRLSDLRESGAIEQDADMVMFLSRENEDERTASVSSMIIDIAKHRNGQIKQIRYLWEGAHVRFTEAPASNQEFDATKNLYGSRPKKKAEQ
ncbi:MAG: replicative DNA helicase [Clostridia bacterium]|nr:replicative DNA helicase [Clostridia bacterium]